MVDNDGTEAGPAGSGYDGASAVLPRVAGSLSEWAVPGVTHTADESGDVLRARTTSVEAMGGHPVISRWLGELKALTDSPAEFATQTLHELFLALTGFHDLLEARTAPVAVAWKERGDWEADGSRSPQHALARDTGQSPDTCAAVLRRAKQLTSQTMPATRAAWQDGAISTDTAELLMRAAAGKRAALFAEDETTLLATVQGRLHVDVVKAVRYWRDNAGAQINPDGTPPGRERHLHLSPTFGGVVALDGVLDPVGGAIVLKAMRDIDAELRALDTKAAAASVEAGGDLGGMRTSSERLADALVEMALRATKAPADGKRPTIALKVAVGTDKLAHLCETFAGHIVRPSDLTDYLADTTLQFIRFSPDGQPEAATRTMTARRFFTGALRTAIQVRDRRCQHPAGCNAPIDQCDVDHHQPYARHGRTDIDNGKLLCEPHNRIMKLRHPQRE